MTAPRKLDPYRRALYAKISIAQKALGLDDDTYRDLLEVRTGKRSRTRLRNAELVDLIEYFKSIGFRPRRVSAPSGAPPAHRMIRALWLALHNLAAVDDASEAALRAFVRRQAKVDALTFLTPDQAFSVIEALKGWCRRLGYVVDEDLLASKRALLRAIWHRLGDLGALDTPSDFGLDGWISHRIVPRESHIGALDAPQLDAAANRLGAWLRREMAGKAAR